MKKFLAILLTIAMTVSLLAGCGSDKKETSDSGKKTEANADTREFTDSLGRTVEIPADVTKIAVTGPMAQIVVFALAPDELVGFSSDWSEDAKTYIDPKYFDLPVLGQLYGGKGDLNKEELLNTGAEVVIDVGEQKDGMKEDMDNLSADTGIPFVHIDGTLSTMDEAYTMLGELLGKEDEAAALSAYCSDTYSKVSDIAAKVGDNKVRVLYCLGDFGTNIIAQGSFHSEVLDLLVDNVAVVDDPSSKGTGNEVDMEQIMNWDPDVVIFAPDSIYADAAEDQGWANMRAVKDGKYYEVPFGPYNWMGFPPSVQRYLGMLWLAKLLYPDQADYDLYQECAQYYDLFYHYDLTEEQYNKLVENSIGMMD